MGWRLAYVRSTIRALRRIRSLHKRCMMPEMVRIVEEEAGNLALKSDREMEALSRHWWFWTHSSYSVHRNPCLYFSMLSLSHELASGRDAEVNVWLSSGLTRDRGHCWVTRNGQLIHDQDRRSIPDTIEELGREGRIVYWWNHTEDS